MDSASQFVKGVYTSIDEFRNNKPSISKYELSKDRNANLELSIPDENGKFYYTHTAWGLCDGKQRYVMMDGNLFPVFRVDHQFYVLGSKQYRTKKTIVPFFLPLTGAVYVFGTAAVSQKVVRELDLFRLDTTTVRSSLPKTPQDNRSSAILQLPGKEEPYCSIFTF
jgi:hypothetical protein